MILDGPGAGQEGGVDGLEMLHKQKEKSCVKCGTQRTVEGAGGQRRHAREKCGSEGNTLGGGGGKTTQGASDKAKSSSSV